MTPPGPFSTGQGIAIRVKDELSSTPPTGDGVDVTAVFAVSDCSTMGDVVRCGLTSGAGRGAQLKLKRNQFARDQIKFAFRLRGLSLAKPFFGPIKVIVGDDTTVHRLGQIIDCRLFPTGIRCREF